MKGRQLGRLVATWVNARPGLVFRDKMVIQVPIGMCLAGVVFEARPHAADGLYLNGLVQPLYVPSDHIELMTADVVGIERTLWHLSDADQDVAVAAMLNHAFEVVLPAAIASATPPVLATRLWPADQWTNLNVVEVLAYSLVLAREFERAQNTLRFLLDSADMPAPWNQDILNRARVLVSKLNVPGQAEAQLGLWRDQSISALGLDSFSG
jgi:hypothetical protein